MDGRGLATATLGWPGRLERTRVEPLPLGSDTAPIEVNWRRLPAFRGTSDAEFSDHRWQAKNSVLNVDALRQCTAGLVAPSFYEDVERGLCASPMAMRLSPYLMSLIDWDQPYQDPIRRQFIPLATEQIADHPLVDFDPLCEQAHMPVPGLTHRYPHKALFLALRTCPVYCRFCTRSYTVGLDTPSLEKARLDVAPSHWHEVFDYVSTHEELEDVVVSGGDVYQLRAEQLEMIGLKLLSIPHVRRIRFASKGPAVMPQKLLSDTAWLDALTRVVDGGRQRGKHVALHVHFNHPREISSFTVDAMLKLFQRGIVVRNQSVLLRGVNDDVLTLRQLFRRLSRMNVQPYYVYLHDLARGVEDLRTSLQTALDLEKRVRGFEAGFNTPCFVVDAMGGGGKRDAHSFEYYDRETGVAVFRSPAMDSERLFFYLDPLHLLSASGRERWAAAHDHKLFLSEISERVQTRPL